MPAPPPSPRVVLVGHGGLGGLGALWVTLGLSEHWVSLRSSMRVRTCRSPRWGAPGTALHVVSPCLCQEATVGHQSRGLGSFRCHHGGPREGTLAQGAKGAPLHPCPHGLGTSPPPSSSTQGRSWSWDPPCRSRQQRGPRGTARCGSVTLSPGGHMSPVQCHAVPMVLSACPWGGGTLSLGWWHAVPTLVAHCPKKSVTLSPDAVRQGRRVKGSGTEMALGSKPGHNGGGSVPPGAAPWAGTGGARGTSTRAD